MASVARIGLLTVVSVAITFVFAAGVGAAATKAEDADPYLPLNQMMVANGCSNCHGADYTRVGPPMIAMATAYADASPEELTRLKEAMLKGTKGRWGAAIMPAQAQLTPAQADAIITMIQKFGAASR